MSISFKEDHISQIPALLMLEKLGYTYLTPDEALALRGGNLANVLLEPVLRKQLAAINVVQVSSVRTTVFSEQNITAGIDALRNIPMDEGFMEASQTVYDLLTSGKTLEQIVDGDRKSFVMQYIDWKNPRNNVFRQPHGDDRDLPARHRPLRERHSALRHRVQASRRKGLHRAGHFAAPPQPEGRRHPFAVPLLDAAAGHQPPGGQLRHDGHAREVLGAVARAVRRPRGGGPLPAGAGASGQRAAAGRQALRGAVRLCAPQL